MNNFGILSQGWLCNVGRKDSWVGRKQQIRCEIIGISGKAGYHRLIMQQHRQLQRFSREGEREVELAKMDKQ